MIIYYNDWEIKELTHFRSVWIWEHKLHGQKLIPVVFLAPFFSAFVLAELSLRSRQDDQLQGQAHILPTSKPPGEEQLGLSICIKAALNETTVGLIWVIPDWCCTNRKSEKRDLPERMAWAGAPPATSRHVQEEVFSKWVSGKALQWE